MKLNLNVKMLTKCYDTIFIGVFTINLLANQ